MKSVVKEPYVKLYKIIWNFPHWAIFLYHYSGMNNIIKSSSNNF